MTGTDGESESGKSMLSSRLNNEDDNHIWVYVWRERERERERERICIAIL